MGKEWIDKMKRKLATQGGSEKFAITLARLDAVLVLMDFMTEDQSGALIHAICDIHLGTKSWGKMSEEEKSAFQRL